MSTRREFLLARGFHGDVKPSVDTSPRIDIPPFDTIRLGKEAMAADFEVILNPGRGSRLELASAALDLVDRLEDQLSVYRPGSELSRLNQRAAIEPVVAEEKLFELLLCAQRLARATDGAFDPTAGPLVALWRQCRRDRRLPTESELELARGRCGYEQVKLDEASRSVSFRTAGVELNLNAMGKGYALDRAGELLGDNWLMHGGFSSVLARGHLTGADAWPIGIRHPLFPDRSLATLWLKDRGMSTSGSGVQFYRYRGRRYGHLIDPRTGWPVDGVLSVTVVAPTAAEAEALSTAFFVLGVETACEYCHNHGEVAALVIPRPARGHRLDPVVCGLSEADLMFEQDETAK